MKMKKVSPFRLLPPPVHFIGREKEKRLFEKILRDAIGNNPSNIAIIGDRGIGKTALLDEYRKMAGKEKVPVISITLHEGVTTLSYLSLLIIRALEREITKVRAKQKMKKKALETLQRITIKYKDLEMFLKPAEVPEHLELELEPQLLRIWGAVKNEVPAIAIEIDEAEQLEQIQGALQFLRGTFTRLYEEHCNYVIILSGKMKTYKQQEELHSPIARFFPPHELQPLTYQETQEFLNQSLKNKITESKEAEFPAYVFTGGNPYALNMLGDIIFEKAQEQNINRVDAVFIDSLLGEYVIKAGTGLYEKRYSTLSEMEKGVLEIAVKLSTENEEKHKLNIEEAVGEPLALKEIAKAFEKAPNYTGKILDRLIEKECLIKESRGKYKLPSVLFMLYVAIKMEM